MTLNPLVNPNAAADFAEMMWLDKSVKLGHAEGVISNLKKAHRQAQEVAVQAGANLISMQAEAEALRRLSSEMLKELADPRVPRRLSDPAAEKERQRFANEQARISHEVFLDLHEERGVDPETLKQARKEGAEAVELKPLPKVAEREKSMRLHGKIR
jgi:hypothetical protein